MPGNSDLSPHDLSLFLHGSVLRAGQEADSERKPTAAVALRDLPHDVLLQTYRTGEREFLIDPQVLVPEVARMDMERLLEFHGSDARIRLYLLVIDADQKLPEGALLDSIAREALTKTDACLAIYPLGEPWRARFLVSESVHRSVPVQALTELAEDCTHDALRASDPAQQLQRFAIRLSTRLFWLEKSLPAAIAHLPAAPLQEVAAITNAVSSPLPQRRSAWLAFGFGIGTVAVLGGSPALFLVVRGRRRQRHQLSHVWMLPDVDVPTRLGGNFSGGTSAAINYRSRYRGCS